MAGPEGGPGEESFDVEVVTPKWLARMAASGPISGRHMLIVTRYEPDVISDWLHAAVHACSGSSWEEVGPKVARIGHWEFEDYDPWAPDP